MGTNENWKLPRMKLTLRQFSIHFPFYEEKKNYFFWPSLQETIVPVPYKLMKLDAPNDPTPSKRKRSDSETTEDVHAEKAARVDTGRTQRSNRFTKVTINQSDELPSTSQTAAKYKESFLPIVRQLKLELVFFFSERCSICKYRLGFALTVR